MISEYAIVLLVILEIILLISTAFQHSAKMMGMLLGVYIVGVIASIPGAIIIGVIGSFAGADIIPAMLIIAFGGPILLQLFYLNMKAKPKTKSSNK